MQDAVLRNLQTLTESSQRLSEGAKAGEPGIDWRRMAGMRNILVHAYLGGIDAETVWAVIERELPSLEAALKRLQAADAPRPAPLRASLKSLPAAAESPRRAVPPASARAPTGTDGLRLQERRLGATRPSSRSPPSQRSPGVAAGAPLPRGFLHRSRICEPPTP